MIIFETERLYVRHFAEEDLDNLYALSGNAEVMKYIRPPMSKEDSKELLDKQINLYQQHPHFGRYAVVEKVPDLYIGNFVLRPSGVVKGVEIGYAFLQDAWGKGFATELTKGGLKFALEKVNLQKVVAITDIPNEASKKVLFKCGFTQLTNILDNGREVCLFELLMSS